MGVLMHICIYGNAPNYLKDLLIQVSHVQQRFTRASNDFYVPRANIELYKESFYITDHTSGIRYQTL